MIKEYFYQQKIILMSLYFKPTNAQSCLELNNIIKTTNSHMFRALLVRHWGVQ